MSWASLVSRAGSPHALLSLKMVFVFIQEDGLASLPRSRLQQPGSRQLGQPTFALNTKTI